MLQELDHIKEKFQRITASLSDPDVVSDPRKIKELSIERSELDPVVKKYDRYLQVVAELKGAKDILSDPDADQELKTLAKEELESLQLEKEQLETELKVMLIPKDPRDKKNVILEIRAGAGGDEASLFAQDLFRLYSRLAEKNGWNIEVLSTSSSNIRGIKEIIANIKGRNVYSKLKYESGVHRVQRVPETETSGRIHTSTVTVAVLPEAHEVDIELDPKDLRIEAYGASGPGGQNVNRNYTAIRVTHQPSGMVVSCQDEKSQHRNKEKALRILRTRLLDIAQQEQEDEISQDRRAQVGTGERSEKIRTYNFPQNRVTDHRLNVSMHQLENILDGELEEMIEKLTLHFQAKMIGDTQKSA